MTMLLEALNRLRDLISTDITRGQLGTGTDASNENDTELQYRSTATLLALDNITTASKTVKFDYVLNAPTGPTATFTEFELARTSGTAILTNYDRIVFTGLSYTPNGTEDINISKKYFIKGA